MLRLLRQLQDVYSTMRISALAALVPFCSLGEVEAIIVDAVKYRFLQASGATDVLLLERAVAVCLSAVCGHAMEAGKCRGGCINAGGQATAVRTWRERYTPQPSGAYRCLAWTPDGAEGCAAVLPAAARRSNMSQ